jgi:multidrug efflux pump
VVPTMYMLLARTRHGSRVLPPGPVASAHPGDVLVAK